MIGHGLVYYLSQKNAIQRDDLISVFNIAFFVYFLYAFLAYLGFDGDNGFFKYSDEESFYEIGNALGKRGSIRMIFNDCFIERIHLEQEASYFLFGTIAYFANTFFDGNSVLLQIIHVSFFALSINLFVYKILSLYVNRSFAFRYTIYYLFFAQILSYSPWILRDIHIAFIFVIAIYLVHLKFSFTKLFLLIILQIITFELRFEHGFVFSFFPLLFIYGKEKFSRYRYLYILSVSAVIIGIAVLYYSVFLTALNKVTRTLDLYSEFTVLSAIESGGLGALIYRLPFGISHIARVLFSQIVPFPPWRGILYSNNFLQGIIEIIPGLSAVFWGYVIYVSVKDRKYYSSLSFLTKLMMLFVIIFLFLNTANMNPRRLIAVYPIIYLFFVYIISKISRSQNNKNILNYAILYISLIAIYSLAILL